MTNTPENPPDSADPSTDPPGLLPAPGAADVRLTQSELARVIGISKQALSKHVARGSIRLDRDGRASLSRALRDYSTRVDPARRQRRGPIAAAAAREDADLRARLAKLEAENTALRQAIASPAADEGGEGGAAYAELRTRRAQLEVDRLTMTLERERGQWLDRAEVTAALDNAIVIMRVTLQSLPARVVEHVDASDEQRAVLTKQLADGVAAVLWDLCRRFGEMDGTVADEGRGGARRD
jgi:hypothetical protein